MLARHIEEHLDLADISNKLFEKFGPAARPAALLAMTPFELYALLFRPRDDDAEVNRVAELRRHNHVVRAPKWVRPHAPRWVMPKAPWAG